MAISEKQKEYAKAWREKNREKYRAQHREYKRKIRQEAITYYGGDCACCGETRYEFLCIDHIHGRGGLHRKTVGERALARWLKAQGYPEGFQVLCYNCNNAKHNYGQCPHRELMHMLKHTVD